MTDLYTELGIARHPPPSVAQIRASYRRRAKKAHPDGGGSVEEFQRVTEAVAVLTDERRRRVYDETGTIEDAPLDDLDNRALQFLFGQIDFVVGEIERRGAFLDEIDVVGDVRRGFHEKLRQIDDVVKKVEKSKEMAEEVAARFRARSGKVDRIGPMYRAKAVGFAQNLASCERDRKMVQRAIEIFAEHEFEGGGRMMQRGPVIIPSNFFFIVSGT
jgi:curved DNA-binding protein CbpA